MTDGHVIPRAAGGRLSAAFECAQCNRLLGSSVEARLVSDPAMRLGVEALGDRLSPLGVRLRQRQPYVSTDDDVVVRAIVEGSDFRLRDTQQPDRSLVKDRARAREDVATTLERRGADAAEIAAALERLLAHGPSAATPTSSPRTRSAGAIDPTHPLGLGCAHPAPQLGEAR